MSNLLYARNLRKRCKSHYDALSYYRNYLGLGLDLVPLSAAIAEDAAWLRGRAGMAVADAVHLATARAAGATAFVTNDRRIRSRPGVDVLYLDDLEIVEPAT